MTATRPTPSLSDVQVDEGIVLDARLEASVLRMASKLPAGSFGRINADGRDYFVHALPGAVYRVSGERGSPPVKDGSWGAPLWRLLHESALTLATLDERTAFLAQFQARLPCGSCRRDWSAWALAHPWDLTSREAFFADTVAAHDAVNVRLGRPVFGLADARALYGNASEISR